MQMDEQLSGSERAAVLIMYLDKQIARNILQRLSDDEVRAVGLSMGKIERVPPDLITQIIKEFVKELYAAAMVPRSGADFVNNVLPELLDPERKGNILPMLRRRVNRSFEAFISERPAGTVEAILRDEPPQIQAVALSMMGPENAARVLRLLDEDRKLEVTMRMARLKHVPGDLADDVMEAFRDALGLMDDHIDIGGIDNTARILGRMKRTDNDEILDGVQEEDYDLADLLRRRMVVFEDFGTLDNRTIQNIIKHISREDLVTALLGANETLVELFLNNVSARASEDIRDEMEVKGHVQRSFIRAAQERIVSESLRLAEEGVIYLPFYGDDEEEEVA